MLLNRSRQEAKKHFSPYLLPTDSNPGLCRATGREHRISSKSFTHSKRYTKDFRYLSANQSDLIYHLAAFTHFLSTISPAISSCVIKKAMGIRAIFSSGMP